MGKVISTSLLKLVFFLDLIYPGLFLSMKLVVCMIESVSHFSEKFRIYFQSLFVCLFFYLSAQYILFVGGSFEFNSSGLTILILVLNFQLRFYK